MRLLILNAARGAAAVMVAVSHFRDSFDLGPQFHWFAPYLGAYGVALFFFISGFVIPLSLEKIDSSTFLCRRIFRLYPIVIIVCLLRIAYEHLAGIERGLTVQNILLNMSLFGDFFQKSSKNVEGIFWSLNVEVKFYLLMAVVFWLLRRFSIPLFWSIVAIASAAIAALVLCRPFFTGPLPAQYDLAVTLTFLPLMLMGTLLYEKWSGGLSWPGFIAGLMLLVVAFYCSIYRSPVHLIAGANFAAMLWIGDRFKVVRNRLLQWLGDISYPLYAIHPLCIVMVAAQSFSVPAALSIVTVLIIFAAGILHRIVEDPFMRLSKR